MEKLLIECTLELFAAGLVAGIQDLGGAGLSCATSELASAGDGGMHVHLDRVPLRDPTLSPEEILMSESQERMMAVVEPRHVEEFLAICAKWDVSAVAIGEVTERRPVDHRLARRDRGGRPAAHRRPRGTGVRASAGAAGLARPGPAGDLGLTGPAAHRRRTGRDRAPAGRLAQPVRQVLGHRSVRPVRPRQLGARPARGRGHAAHRRGDRTGRRPGHGLQRPLRRTSIRTGRAARRWPRPTATSLPPAPGPSPSPTVSTSGHPRTRG